MSRLLFFLLIPLLSFSQAQTLTGTVSDTLDNPLESANVIAKPLQEKAGIKFSIADNKGRYKLALENDIKYEITVSYIGFADETITITPESNISTHDFKLRPTGEVLKEIVIKHDFKPIEIKKDTLIYDVKAFANGNERKLKEVLEKLPGVEVDKKGTVTVQGKKVTKMLVEGKSFFGGGSKLAVENIPANALDKVEVIDNFNETPFMKQVSDSEDLAMNIKLKEDKKKFVFGDLESGSGNDGHYLDHAALFYYSPKTNVSFIGDMNTIGRSTFTFEDLMRFDGGASSFLTGRKPLTDLYSFADDNTDITKSKSKFGAMNFSLDVSPKLSVSGYALLSGLSTSAKTQSHTLYLQNENTAFEDKTETVDNRSLIGIGNIKLDYSPNKKEKWYYNAQFSASDHDPLQALQSVTDTGNNFFKALGDTGNTSFKEYAEWHKNYGTKHTSTLVVNHAYEKSTPENIWLASQLFLSGLLPLQPDNSYTIAQLKSTKSNTVDALLKHYFVINNFNHIYTSIGNTYNASRFVSTEKQILSNGTTNDFASAGFGNDLHYMLNDAYLAGEYKFKTGKWTNKLGISLHRYDLSTRQPQGNSKMSKTLLQPQWNSDYEFNKSETLRLAYRLAAAFPEANQMASRYTMESYNSVYKGNDSLSNGRYHSASIRYSKINMYRGIMCNATANYNKRIKAITNVVTLAGINQHNTSEIRDNAQENWHFYGSLSKKIYRFTFMLDTSISWFRYMQSLNSINAFYDRNGQDIGLSMKTSYRKWPDLHIGYTKSFSSLNGVTKNNYRSDAIDSSLEFTLFTCLTLQTDYSYVKNVTPTGNNVYQVINTSARYQKKNNPFVFGLTATNLLDTRSKTENTFSDYIISQNAIYILPRIVLLSVGYKL